MNELTINGRFQGPDHMGNGGYVAGLLARPLGNQAQVRLHRPAPLDKPLPWRQSVNGHVRLWSNGRLLAEASPVFLGLSVPAPPPYTAVLAAQQEATYGHDHPFPDCFVCGPNRPHGDGLGLRPTYLPDYNLVAATWLPHESLANNSGLVASEYLWAALDCPGGLAAVWPRPRPILLGQITARVAAGIRPGERCLVLGWPISRQGRKHIVGSALLNENGQVFGRARAVWIEPDPFRSAARTEPSVNRLI
ncbi:MAG: hypothetical protein R6X32_18885 [Chloroflexota bacterium]